MHSFILRESEEYRIEIKSAKETLMYRTVLWTLWERERVGRFGRMALKRKIPCMKRDASPGSMHDTRC